MNHKKKIVSASLLFVGMLSFITLKAEAAAGQGVQDMRYCNINNIYKTPRTDCPLRQDRILDGLDQTDSERPLGQRPKDGTGFRAGNRNNSENGKQDGSGPGRADGPRIPDCPNYEEKQAEATPENTTTPAVEPTALTYGTQPQDGTGNQYGQQNNAGNTTQQGNGYSNNAASGQQNGGYGVQDGSNTNGGQQNSGSSSTQSSTPAPQVGGNQQNGAGRSGTHHGLRDGSGAGGQRGRNAGHCY